MTPHKSLLSAALVVCIGLFAAGCGGVPSASTVSPVSQPSAAISSLAGNWLLYGTMPENGVIPTAQNLGFALDIEVTGTRIIASANVQGACSSTSYFGITYANDLTGTIASDGTFSLTNPGQGAPAGLIVTGTAPKSAGAPWSGTYTVTFNSLGCVTSQSGAFTATSVAQITGTYSGTGSVSFLGTNSNIIPISASLVLQQGSPLYFQGVPTSSPFGLGGSITLQGLPCFSKGVNSTVSPSILDGNEVLAHFTMDDGSDLQVSADITDTNANTLAVGSFHVASGNCAGTYIAEFNSGLILRH